MKIVQYQQSRLCRLRYNSSLFFEKNCPSFGNSLASDFSRFISFLSRWKSPSQYLLWRLETRARLWLLRSSSLMMPSLRNTSSPPFSAMHFLRFSEPSFPLTSTNSPTTSHFRGSLSLQMEANFSLSRSYPPSMICLKLTPSFLPSLSLAMRCSNRPSTDQNSLLPRNYTFLMRGELRTGRLATLWQRRSCYYSMVFCSPLRMLVRRWLRWACRDLKQCLKPGTSEYCLIQTAQLSRRSLLFLLTRYRKLYSFTLPIYSNPNMSEAYSLRMGCDLKVRTLDACSMPEALVSSILSIMMVASPETMRYISLSYLISYVSMSSSSSYYLDFDDDRLEAGLFSLTIFCVPCVKNQEFASSFAFLSCSILSLSSCSSFLRSIIYSFFTYCLASKYSSIANFLRSIWMYFFSSSLLRSEMAALQTLYSSYTTQVYVRQMAVCQTVLDWLTMKACCSEQMSCPVLLTVRVCLWGVLGVMMPHLASIFLQIYVGSGAWFCRRQDSISSSSDSGLT